MSTAHGWKPHHRPNQTILYDRFVEELRTFLDFTGGQAPTINGHLGLQHALSSLCSRIRANQRGARKRAELKKHLQRVAAAAETTTP